MPEYIERSAALREQTTMTEYDEGGWGSNVRVVRVQDIEAIPAADVAPVVHGRWVKVERGTFCTACTRVFDADFEIQRQVCEKLPRCPNCGAKMDLEVD